MLVLNLIKVFVTNEFTNILYSKIITNGGLT
nr:MAG TPA: hypothetical protein [Caudoviricetes sp.]